MAMKNINFHAPEKDRDRWAKIAEKRGWSKALLIREALKAYESGSQDNGLAAAAGDLVRQLSNHEPPDDAVRKAVARVVVCLGQ